MGFLDSLFPPNIEKLKKNGDITGLSELLGSASKIEIKAKAAAALGELKASTPLVKAFKNAPHELRPAIIAALGMIMNDEARDFLHKAAQDADRRKYLPAIEAWGKYPDAESIRILSAALKHKDENARLSALLGLGNQQGEAALQTLVDFWPTASKVEKMAVLRSLEQFGPPAVNFLAARWRSSAAASRANLESLIREFQVSPAPEWAAWYDAAKGKWEHITTLGDTAVDALDEMTKDPDPSLVTHAIQGLGAIGTSASQDILKTIAQNPPVKVEHRIALVKTLSALGWEGFAVDQQPTLPDLENNGIEMLLRALINTQGSVREDAAQALILLYRKKALSTHDLQRLLEMRSILERPHEDSYIKQTDWVHRDTVSSGYHSVPLFASSDCTTGSSHSDNPRAEQKITTRHEDIVGFGIEL